MNGKLKLTLAIVLIFIQLLVPFGMISYHEITDMQLEKFSGEYKFRITPDFVSSTAIVYSVDSKLNVYGRYALVRTNSDGFSEIYKDCDTRPGDGVYITGERKTFYFFTSGIYNLKNPISESRAEFLNNYYTDYYTRYDYYSENRFEPYLEAYMTVKIYKGHVKITGIVIDGETFS